MRKVEPMIREFYENLSDAQIETLELDGRLLASRNNSKLHACKKGPGGVRFLCQDKAVSLDYWSRSFEIVDTREFIESERLCKNCKRMIQDRTGYTRVTLAVEGDELDKATLERLANKVQEA